MFCGRVILCLDLPLIYLYPNQLEYTYEWIINSVFLLQERIVQIITFSSYIKHSSPHFKYKLQDLVKFVSAVFMFKLHNSLLLSNSIPFLCLLTNYTVIIQDYPEHYPMLYQNLEQITVFMMFDTKDLSYESLLLLKSMPWLKLFLRKSKKTITEKLLA